MDPNAKVLEGVIRSLIYGVRSVSAQTEVLINMIAEKILTEHPQVALFLVRCRYVDDMAKGTQSHDECQYLIKTVDETFKNYQLKVKGWAVSKQKPSSDLSSDGLSVSFAGVVWMTELDIYSLNHQPLHFGKKIRGRLPQNLRIFDPKKETLEQFCWYQIQPLISTSKIRTGVWTNYL